VNLSDYNKCVTDHADGVFRFVVKHIKDRDTARDIVQDSFEKMWRKLDSIDATKSKTYLFTTAYHHLVDHVRRNARNVREAVNTDHAAEFTEYSGVQGILNVALEKLPEIQKSVLLLRDYEGYDYAEIGRITGLNESQVKVYIFRARVFLKNYIGSLQSVI
jgi:RNA polymerase sigma factor (sigma-70 family)